MSRKKLNLIDILSANSFYNNIVKAANLTARTEKESSFCINGNEECHKMTKVLEEEEDFCAYGNGLDGITYMEKDWGWYKPGNMSRIIAVHFHTPKSNAYPSFEDISAQYDWLNENIESHVIKNNPIYNIVSVIGHKPANSDHIKLFIAQFKEGLKFEENIPYELSLLSGKYNGIISMIKVNKSFNKEEHIPLIVSYSLSKLTPYRTRIISFKNKAQYLTQINKKLKDFKLTYNFKVE